MGPWAHGPPGASGVDPARSGVQFDFLIFILFEFLYLLTFWTFEFLINLIGQTSIQKSTNFNEKGVMARAHGGHPGVIWVHFL